MHLSSRIDPNLFACVSVCELVIGELTDLVSVGVLWRPTTNRLIGSLCVAFDANDARALSFLVFTF